MEEGEEPEAGSEILPNLSPFGLASAENTVLAAPKRFFAAQSGSKAVLAALRREDLIGRSFRHSG